MWNVFFAFDWQIWLRLAWVQLFRTCHSILAIQTLYSSSDTCQTHQVWHFPADLITLYPCKGTLALQSCCTIWIVRTVGKMSTQAVLAGNLNQNLETQARPPGVSHWAHAPTRWAKRCQLFLFKAQGYGLRIPIFAGWICKGHMERSQISSLSKGITREHLWPKLCMVSTKCTWSILALQSELAEFLDPLIFPAQISKVTKSASNLSTILRK